MPPKSESWRGRLIDRETLTKYHSPHPAPPFPNNPSEVATPKSQRQGTGCGGLPCQMDLQALCLLFTYRI
jgi:hypothetical protein